MGCGSTIEKTFLLFFNALCFNNKLGASVHSFSDSCKRLVILPKVRHGVNPRAYRLDIIVEHVGQLIDAGGLEF